MLTIPQFINVVVLNLFLTAGSTDAPVIPATLGQLNGRPIWVDAESAVDRSGRPNAAFLGEEVARKTAESAKRNAQAVERARATRRGGAEAVSEDVDECQVFKTWMTDHFKPTHTLEQLIANSGTIVAGTVVAQREGIFYDTPGTLLRLDAQYLKGQATTATYLFYPYGRIKTADGMLCSRPFNDDDAAPEIGDRFIVFAVVRPYYADGVTLLAPDPGRELLREAAGGKLTLPRSLRSADTSPGNFDAIRDRIRNRLQPADK